MSNESGRSEIYVRSFVTPPAGATVGAAAEDPAGLWQVSTAGGIFPKWARDGRELYYIGPDGQMTAVPVKTADGTFEPGEPVMLFETRINGGGDDVGQGPQFDVTRDGRFLILTDVNEAPTPITLLLNWTNPK